MTNARQRALEAFQKFRDRLEPRHVIVNGIVGDGVGNADVPNRTGYCWVRVAGAQSQLTQALCEIIVPVEGMHVLLEEMQVSGQKSYKVIGRPDTQGWFDTERGSGAGSLAPAHHWAHELGGADMVNVAPYMLEAVRATATEPASLQVYVSPGHVVFGSEVQTYTGGLCTALTAPSWGRCWTLISLDSDLVLNNMVGVSAWTNPILPPFTAGELPICFVLLLSADTVISNARIYDARPIWAIGDVAAEEETGSGTGDHVHVANEDLTEECDGAKVDFLAANAFEPDTLIVYQNGQILRPGAAKDFVEYATYDGFELSVAPAAIDTLVCEYLAEH